MRTSALSSPLPARSNAPLVCVGVAAVGAEAVEVDAVGVGVSEVLETPTVHLVSGTKDEEVVVIGEEVLSTFVEALGLGLKEWNKKGRNLRKLS